MEEQNNDVNQDQVETPVQTEESSPAVNEGASSGETLNPEDKTPENVPYSRFKEKVDEYNSLKTNYDSYKQFDDYLTQNPDKAKAILDLIKQEEAAQAQAQPTQNDPINVIDTRLRELERVHMATEAQRRVNSYKEEFSSLMAKENIPDDVKPFVEEMVELKLIQEAKGDPIANFDVKTLHKAFKTVNDNLQRVLKSDKSRYINSKLSNDVPVNSKGAAPREAPTNPQTREDRNAAILEELRASRK